MKEPIAGGKVAVILSEERAKESLVGNVKF